MLEQALHDLGKGSGDVHVEDLANRVRSLEKSPTSREGTELDGDRAEMQSAKPIGSGLSRIKSTDEYEEVEKSIQ